LGSQEANDDGLTVTIKDISALKKYVTKILLVAVLLKTVTVKGLMNVEDDKIETFSVL
jgi:hypothetical protein